MRRKLIMQQNMITLPDNVYRLLIAQAEALQLSPAEIIERVVTSDFIHLLVAQDDPELSNPAPTTTEEALAAVYRLTHLFADVPIEGLEEMLNDPMAELINVDLDEFTP